MRPSKYDKYICIATLIIFLYSFFVIGTSYVYCEDIHYPDMRCLVCSKGEVIGIEYPSSVIIAPFVFIVFFFFIVFEHELLPVNRKWMRLQIRKGFRWLRWKLRDGFREYKDWKY